MSKKVKLQSFRNNRKKKQVESLTTWSEFFSNQCTHCGGAHLRACPRIRKMAFHTDGSLNEIEFWPDGQWDTSNVLWPESIVDAGENENE